jgi:hypothetical protein
LPPAATPVDNSGCNFLSFIDSAAELDAKSFASDTSETDPLFVDPEAGNFRLQLTSPLVDSGHLMVPRLSDLDLDGNPRVQDGDGDTVPLPDVGAYERPSPGAR